MYGSIPGSLPNRRAYRDRPVPERVSATRGCKIPCPSETRSIRSSYRGRFSGCAMAPTNCRAESRGSCVSESSGITNLTFDRSAVFPTTSEKRSGAPPRRRSNPLRASPACVRNPSRSAPADSIGAGGEKGRTVRSLRSRTCRSALRSPSGPTATALRPPGSFPRSRPGSPSSRPKCRLLIPICQGRTSRDSTRDSMLLRG